MNFNRVKWYILEVSISLDDIYETLKASAYSEIVGSGSQFVEISDGLITSSFIEKNVLIEEVLTPDGLSERHDVVYYSYTSFKIESLNNEKFLLTVFDPKKSMKGFFSFLTREFHGRLFVKNIYINLRDFINLICNDCGIDNLHVERVKVSGLIINKNSKASLDLVSDKNALIDLDCIKNSDNCSLDKIKGALVSNEKIGFEITKSALLKVDDKFYQRFNEYIIFYLISYTRQA